MDLIGGYLLVLLVLSAANIALILGNYKLNNSKLIIISLAFAALSFALMYASSYLTFDIMDYFAYLFFIIAAVIFISLLYCSKTDDFKIPFYLVFLTFIISQVLFSSQSDLPFISMILYSLFVFIVLFVTFKLTDLLHHAKRPYSAITGEYMCLFSLLMFIFALTYNSTRNLDYTMFSPFLILTPTYQLIYIIIGIVVILVVGVLINDTKGGNK